ncbi:SDR family NAD(P)-dependent oxidoreductase [Halorubrum vacuolatum]|uniref:3-oxoacyl-[acyl-carrier-protein] reductase n=1 Tax=Halorubrum vacuolatum TaxID=63740 RepID=A0A238WKW9_HALVU|nr:glucose 1-dehydrogenase [Halorubrum vacuolatum]SNR47068.1 3-oxoacyl-[acyl-carrier-protein] reductase [Halorubrum vacuolatum]
MTAVLITGSSRGIGRAIAHRFAHDGYDVIINYQTNEAAAEDAVKLVESTGSGAIAVEADVSDPDAAARLVERGVETFGGLDHVVNNAGIDQHVHTESLSPADFDHVMDVNVNGAFNVTKAALSALEASEDDPSVTNVSSILAHTGAPIECHYAASKGALLSLTRSHAADFAPDIRVNAVAPGHIETDMTADRTPEEAEAARAEIPIGRFGRPAEIADAVAYLRDATFVTGETLNVNGGESMR